MGNDREYQYKVTTRKLSPSKISYVSTISRLKQSMKVSSLLKQLIFVSILTHTN